MSTIKETQKITVNRLFKARIFEMIFSDKNELLELYNAVSGNNYEDPELLQVNTLKNAIYLSMHNDLSFVIDMRLSLYEQQSIYNPNLPTRFLMYIADIYSEMTKDSNLYGEKKILIPAPRFIVFYNGEKEQPDRVIMKLSELYQVTEDNPMLELEAIMLNINPGHNEEIKNLCKTLKDYAEYTARIRNYSKDMSVEDAVERAITECIREGILSEFLRRNRAEAKKVSIYEYDEAKHMKMEREEGRIEGIKNSLLTILRIKNGEKDLPVEITEKILQETDEAVLNKWLSQSVKIKSIELP